MHPRDDEPKVALLQEEMSLLANLFLVPESVRDWIRVLRSCCARRPRISLQRVRPCCTRLLLHMIPLHPFCFIRGVCSGCFSVTRGPSTSGAGRKATRTTIVGEGAGRAKRGRAAGCRTHSARDSGRCGSVRGQPHVGMRGEDVHHDVEVGLAGAAFQRIQLGIDGVDVEGAWL